MFPDSSLKFHLNSRISVREIYPDMCCCAQSCPPLWTVAHQAPLSVEFPRQSTGVGCHALLQGIFTQGSNLHLLCVSSVLAGGFFITNATWEAHPDMRVENLSGENIVAIIHTFILFLSYNLQSFMAFSFVFKNLKVVLKFYCLNPNSSF